MPIAFVLINIAIKLRYIKYPSIAIDEPFSIYYSQFDIDTIIRFLSTGNNPPLFEIILHYWIKVFGISELSVRFLPCLFSSLSVFFIYRIGQKFFKPAAGAIASLLFTLSNYHIFFAHEARVYPIFLFLTCVSIYCFLNLVHDPKNRRHQVLLVVSNTLIIYAHFFGFFVLLTQFLGIITIGAFRKTALKQILVSFGVTGLLYLPYSAVILKRFIATSQGGTWVTPVSDIEQLQHMVYLWLNGNKAVSVIFLITVWVILQRFIFQLSTPKFFGYIISAISTFYLLFCFSQLENTLPWFGQFRHDFLTMASYVVFIIGLVIIAMLDKKTTTSMKLILLWFFLPLLTIFTGSIWIPAFVDRYVIFVTPAFYVLLSIGLMSLQKSLRFPLSFLTVTLLLTTFNMNVSNSHDVKRMVEQVKELEGQSEETIVYICPDYFDINFAYYYDQNYFKDVDLESDDDMKKNLRMNLRSANVYPIKNFCEIDTSVFKRGCTILYVDAAADFSYQGNNIYEFLRFNMDTITSHYISLHYNVHEFKHQENLSIEEKPDTTQLYMVIE